MKIVCPSTGKSCLSQCQKYSLLWLWWVTKFPTPNNALPKKPTCLTFQNRDLYQFRWDLPGILQPISPKVMAFFHTRTGKHGLQETRCFAETTDWHLSSMPGRLFTSEMSGTWKWTTSANYGVVECTRVKRCFESGISGLELLFWFDTHSDKNE